ncbi:hypothetical protein V6R21_32320 [Limibacter armeniacum]|uniref:hypothetical protein n=1 Tax=Limibacter armeniacum TaxID=466084 RepID=UPI002FE59DA9
MSMRLSPTVLLLDNYLYKFLKKRNKQKRLRINPNLCIGQKGPDRKRMLHMLEQAEKYNRVHVLMHNPTLSRRYRLQRLIKEWFCKEMLDFVLYNAKRNHGHNVLLIISEFLELHQISEDDLQRETAYKTWQRSNHKKELDHFLATNTNDDILF